jgi:SAM-dependent methyltransferase
MAIPSAPSEHRPSVIPSWLVPLLSLPLRRLWDRPERLVLPQIQPGDRILELGPGSGFFTFPMARATGAQGRVLCVELQEPVRRRLQRAVARHALPAAIDVRPCTADSLQAQDLNGSVDLAVAIDVLHETPDPGAAIRELAASLRPGGRLLIREPRGHCPEPLFQAELAWAAQAGLQRLPDPWAPGLRVHGALFQRAG